MRRTHFYHELRPTYTPQCGSVLDVYGVLLRTNGRIPRRAARGIAKLVCG